MKYIQVRNYLRALVTQSLSVGDAIPSERELCQSFGVARMTIRQAVDALVIEGILERVQGKGTFVARPKLDLQARLSSFSEEMTIRGLSPRSELLRADVRRPPPDVSDLLNLDGAEKTFYLYRLRLADDEPICLSEDWVPVRLAPMLFSPAPPASIFAALAEIGLAPEWGEDAVEADEASPDEALRLGVSPQRAVLRVSRRSFHADVAVGYSRTAYRADRYSIWVPVAAPKPALSTQPSTQPTLGRGELSVAPAQ